MSCAAEYSTFPSASSPPATDTTSPHPQQRLSKRARKPAAHCPNSLTKNIYPRGSPITVEEKLMCKLNNAKIEACSLVAADDILVPIFDDMRNGLRIRRVGSRQLSAQEARLLKEGFRTALSPVTDANSLTLRAETFTERMKSHGIVAIDGHEADAFSNLALRYSQLKNSSLVRVGCASINGRIEARIVAKTQISRGTILLELGGLMSANSIEPQPRRRTRKHKVASTPTFEMFSVIWRAFEQCGPGPKKDRLLLGPARFINHSCKPNCKLVPFPKTNAWGVEVSKDVLEEDEITVSYGNYYFGPGECACAPCMVASDGISMQDTPATSLASSPAPSSVMEEPCCETVSHGKRKRLDSEVKPDAIRPRMRARK